MASSAMCEPSRSTLAALVLLLLAPLAYAQQYHMVPSDDPVNPYRIEQIVPPDTRDVPTFDEGIETLRSLEGIDPGATARIMQGPVAAPVPAELCSTPTQIQPCSDVGMTVQ